MYIIYKITNKINSKIYIGVTSESLKKRFKLHFLNSLKKKHLPLYKDFSELGFDNFYIEELTSVLTENDASKMESLYIKNFKEKGVNLYNAHSSSNLKKIFFSYNLETGEIKEYFGMDTLKKHSPGKVSVILENKPNKDGYFRKSHDGKLWSYLNTKDNWDKLIKEEKNKRDMPNKRQVLNVTTGEFYSSCRDAAKAFNLKNSVSISEACNGRKKTAAKCVWKYVD